VSVDRARDDLVGPSCLVLVDDRSALAVVSHPRHQILQACPAGYGEVVAGVPQIVKVQSLGTDRLDEGRAHLILTDGLLKRYDSAS
jgi:hypothetical protein